MNVRRIVIQVVAGVVMAVPASAAQADTIFVDVDNCPGPGSGTPGDPYCSIQTGIDNALPSDEIIVAPGLYNESIDLLGKRITLRSELGAGVTTIDASGIVAATVRLESGEGPYAVIEGFTITGGSGEPDLSWRVGGGIFVQSSSPTIRNCVITANTADLGGGAGINGGSPTFESCVFEGNSAASSGGGLRSSSPSAIFDDCTFTGNTAGYWGGGAYFRGDELVTDCRFEANTAEAGAGCALSIGGPTLTRCVLTDNVAQGEGGGLFIYLHGDNVLTDCQIESNQAVEGGGVYIEPWTFHEGSVAMEGCILIANTATVGGGLAVREVDAVSLSDCQLSDNTAIIAGGAIHTVLSSPQVTGCTFTGNGVEPAFGEGGALYISEESSPAVSACTFTGNTAGYGGAVYNFLMAAPAYDGCAFVGNIAGTGGAACNFLTGDVSYTGCTFALNTAGLDGGAMWNRLCAPVLSQCTIADNTAENGGGIYNLTVSLTLHDVTFDGNWANLWAGGLYGEDTVVDLAGCTFQSNVAQHQAGGGMYLDGCGNEADPMSISDCVFDGNEGSTSAIDFSADCHAYLRWCEFTHNTDMARHGGAISGGQVLMEDCLFSANSEAGAYASNSSSYELRRCTISSDEVKSRGQLLVADCDFTNGRVITDVSGTADVERCKFDGGTVGSQHSSQLTVSDCTFDNCDFQGVYAQSATFVTNCVFRDCVWGVRAYSGSQPLELVNCVFTGCSIGLVKVFHHNVQATQCTFWGNTKALRDDDGLGEFIVENSIITDPIDVNPIDIVINYSDILDEELDFGFGNIKVDPMFVDPAARDFHLLPGSPCIDAADNTAVPEDITTDLDGNPRFHDDLGMPDTGNGDPPIVDMGAYEFQGTTLPCPWDCALPGNGQVEVSDFLALLAQWGSAGSSCDFDGGGVGVTDFLALLAAWGPCP
jgi:hypothetical protein